MIALHCRRAICDFLECLSEQNRPVSKTSHTRVTRCKIAHARPCHIVRAKQALIVAPRYLEQISISQSIKLLLQLWKNKISIKWLHLISVVVRPRQKIDLNQRQLARADVQSVFVEIIFDPNGDSLD